MIKHNLLTKENKDAKRVAFIMGWGNTLQDPWLDWLKERVSKESWSLLIIEIPTEYADFNAVLKKIRSVLCEYHTEALFCHSMGSLFGRYIDSGEIKKKIYLSPFWKIPKRTLIFGSESLSRMFVTLLRWCKKPILDRNFKNGDIGVLEIPNYAPSRISPATMHAVMRAQSSLPHMSEEDMVIYFPDDRVIDTSILKGITYEGGHFAFCVSDRDRIFDKLAALINESNHSY